MSTGIPGLTPERLAFREAIEADVYAHPGSSSGMIAMRLGYPTMRVTKIAAKLERDGLVERRPRRGQAVRIYPTVTP